jgi:sulfur-oxidizing protein SoxY
MRNIDINPQRRTVIKGLSGAALLKVLAGAGIIAPTLALADWNKAAFEAKSMADTLKALGATAPPESRDVQVTGPDIAENGAVVPVGVNSALANTTMVAILIEKNPTTLAATFTIPEGTEANVQTRVKMGQTSNVYALVKADGKFYMTGKEIKVTLGGCGG